MRAGPLRSPAKSANRSVARHCLVLARWVNKLNQIGDALRAGGYDAVTLRGGMGAKARANALARLHPEEGGPPLLAVATGSYIG